MNRARGERSRRQMLIWMNIVQRKLPLLETLMDTLYAKCVPIITSCVMAGMFSPRFVEEDDADCELELEKLGPKYRIALRIARDERWERLKCDHKGVYADDCLVDRIMKHKIYLVCPLSPSPP